jgi:hypothetical protein
VVAGVVDAEHGAGVHEAAGGAVDGLEVEREQAGVPVVDVEHEVLAHRRAVERDAGGGLDGGAGEQREAEQVVAVGALAVAVDAAAVEARVVDEDVVHAVDLRVEVRDLVRVPEEVHGGAHAGVPGVRVLLVAGRDGHHMVSEGREGLGQGAAHVTEAAGLGPGRDLRGDNRDVHRLCSSWDGGSPP